ARVPVAAFGCGLRTPVRPDPELGIAKPVGARISLKRFASAEKWIRSGFAGCRTGESASDIECGDGAGEVFDGRPAFYFQHNKQRFGVVYGHLIRVRPSLSRRIKWLCF